MKITNIIGLGLLGAGGLLFVKYILPSLQQAGGILTAPISAVTGALQTIQDYTVAVQGSSIAVGQPADIQGAFARHRQTTPPPTPPAPSINVIKEPETLSIGKTIFMR